MKKSIKFLTALSLTVPFLITANAEKWDKKITTKVDVETFWNQVKETREIKYGKDPSWDKNMDSSKTYVKHHPLKALPIGL